MRGVEKAWFAALLIACAVLPLASLAIGAETLSFSQAWSDWQSDKHWKESPTLSILIAHRLPRTLAALLAGAGLAVVGCAFQALLRNPLATPYTLGLASAGAFGAWTATIAIEALGIVALTNLNRWLGGWGFSLVQMSAFAMALLDVFIIYSLAKRHRRMSPSVLLLTGVTLGMMANAGIILMRYLASPDRLVHMERWLMGGVDVLGYQPIVVLLIGVVPGSLILVAQSARFDQLGFSPEIAESRGINPQHLQRITFFVGSFVVAVIVSKVGPIGFVGLIVPHCVRVVTGSRHRILMPVSMLAGGAFLCFCDIIARVLLTGETPIGVITSLIGVPFFLILLIRRGFDDWDM
jgi:iron complex transport system permease protein